MFHAKVEAIKESEQGVHGHQVLHSVRGSGGRRRKKRRRRRRRRDKELIDLEEEWCGNLSCIPHGLVE